MENDMVERVARAIQDAAGNPFSTFEFMADMRMKQAQAALAPIQQPTPAMVEAGRDEFWRLHKCGDGTRVARSIWTAMARVAAQEASDE